MRVVFVALLGTLLFLPAYGQPAPELPASTDQIEQLSEGAQALARKVRGAVVQVKVRRVRGVQNPGSGDAQLSKERGSGSGFFVDEDGYIVTNAHVVSGASTVQVQRASPPPPVPGEESILRPRGSLLEAEVVGIDTETDVAVLKVEGRGYPTLSFGDSDQLRRGQMVFAFGSPMGLENSMSMGVISATARQLRPGDPMIYVQTDAPINPGSSGGPLVDESGQVVGMNTLNVSQSGGSEGLGFAGPSNIVRAVYEQIREHGRVRRGVIGVNAQTITPELARALDLNRSYRVLLGDVFPGSPAERAGLRPGDVITHLNGEPMHNGRELHVNLYPKYGSLVRLGVARGDSTFETDVRVVRRRDDAEQFASMANPEEHLVEKLGILALPLTDDIAKHVANLRLPSGVVVAASSRPATPWGDQLRPGDVIYTLGERRIENPDELRSFLSEKASGTRLLAHVLREGEMKYLVLQTT
ncbi:MAG: trypsin-like peptidase domain-containing protein [Salinibacter sp.]